MHTKYNFKTYRQSLTKAELKLAKERAGLRLKNGGLRIHLCSHMANAAFVGAWCKLSTGIPPKISRASTPNKHR
jgi:hypothetical protein